MTPVTQRARLAWLIAFALGLSACSGAAATTAAPAATTTSVPVVVASATNTAAPTSTTAPSATLPPTATLAPSATPTLPPPSATPSLTPLPASATAKATLTARPAATRTRAPLLATATATAAPSDTSVPVSGGSESFSRDSFISSLQRTHTAMQDFIQQLGRADSSGAANCTALLGDFGAYSSGTNYSNVPDPWLALHTEYRAAIQEAVTGAQPVETICNGGGGLINHDLYLQILAQIDEAQNRIFKVQTQAASQS